MKKFLPFLLISQMAWATNYKVDASHTNLGFKVKHLVISNVTGRFNKFDGSFNFDEKTGALSDIALIAEANSIDTNEPDRDKHLKGADFFDVEKFKTLTFNSTKITKKSAGKYSVTGNLTIHGVTKLVVLDAEVNGPVTDPWKNVKLAFTINAKIKRTDFGLVWNKTLDKGGVVVAEEVKLEIEGESIAQ
jgi:polyisoprenoid-binding protein YceI